MKEVRLPSQGVGMPRAAWQRAATMAAMAFAVTVAPPAAAASGSLVPSSAYVQAGTAEKAEMLIAGAMWQWNWHRDVVAGRLSGYWEASFGRWNSDNRPPGGSAWVTQLGVTPVLRLYPEGAGGRWFFEGGIGANFLIPVYRSQTKRFSTSFNFGDHLAFGRRFGQDGSHEISLRVQHFSNAGIKKPNPGENFLQIRYSRRFSALGGP
jgi:hypothetical protein